MLKIHYHGANLFDKWWQGLPRQHICPSPMRTDAAAVNHLSPSPLRDFFRRCFGWIPTAKQKQLKWFIHRDGLSTNSTHHDDHDYGGNMRQSSQWSQGWTWRCNDDDQDDTGHGDPPTRFERCSLRTLGGRPARVLGPGASVDDELLQSTEWVMNWSVLWAQNVMNFEQILVHDALLDQLILVELILRCHVMILVQLIW